MKTDVQQLDSLITKIVSSLPIVQLECAELSTWHIESVSKYNWPKACKSALGGGQNKDFYFRLFMKV